MSNVKSIALPALALSLVAAGCGSSRNTPGLTSDKADMATPPGFFDLAGITPPDLVPVKGMACGEAKAPGMPAKRPVDIIIVIDNSGSMTQKILGVQNTINQNLAKQLNDKNIDYRTIFITSYGDYNKQYVCIAPPLSGNNCLMPVGKPVLTERYKHYDYNIQSFDSFDRILDSYKKPDVWGLAPNGWSGFLRANALKIFIEITDDNPTMPGPQFDFQLRVLDPAQFGTDKKRNYIFHSIVGIAANNPPTKAWVASDGMQRVTKCGKDAENWGEEYQALSILTGGLRYPICLYNNFDAIFTEIGKGVMDGTRLACEILVPPVPDPLTQVIAYESITVDYTPSSPPGSAPIKFTKVDSLAACRPDAFYLSPDQSRILLCPDACTVVQKDNAADLVVLYNCDAIGGAQAPRSGESR